MNNDSPRTRILQRIHTALQRDELSTTEQNCLLDYLREPAVHEQPRLSGALLSTFIQNLEKLAGTVTTVKDETAISQTVCDYLQQQQIDLQVVMDATLQNLIWSDALQIAYRTAEKADKVSVTRAFAGIAETGSIVMLSRPTCSTPLNFLPDIHIVILYQTDLVGHIEDVWAKIREMQDMPRTINLITGPSRTADIEQTIQLGAHGPRRLHVIIVAAS